MLERLMTRPSSSADTFVAFVASPRGILLLAAVLFLANLWGYDLWAPDEPYFAEGAREMIVDGKWAVPHVNGVVTTDKPPLFFWLIAVFSLPFGKVYSLTARLPSVLAALGTLWLVMRLGRRTSDPRTAVLAGFVLATSFMFWEKARWTQIDSTLCFLIWAALSVFEAFRAGDLDGRRAGVLFWSAAALAVLAKGPVGLLLPLGIACFTLVVDRNLAAWKRFAPGLGPLAFTIIIAAWMVLATVGGQGEYSVWGALKEHFLERGLHGMHHAYPWYYYLVVLPPQLLPWTGLVPGALYLAARRRDDSDRFLLTAALFVVIFFSISTEKRELYALPAYPAFALMVARLVGHVSRWYESKPVSVGPRWILIGQGIVGGVLALAGVALLTMGHRIEEAPRWVVVLVAAIALTTGVSTLVALARRRLLPTVVVPAAGFVVAYLTVAFVIYPAFETRKSARPLAMAMREASADSRAAGHRVVGYRLGNLPEPLAFYSDGVYTVEAGDQDVLVRHLAQSEQVFAVVTVGDLDALPAEIRNRVVVVARYKLGSDVALISNGPPGESPTTP
jgi:4-amino-4-deoxy-L-arabinose transferase-like glycosyltransferase